MEEPLKNNAHIWGQSEWINILSEIASKLREPARHFLLLWNATQCLSELLPKAVISKEKALVLFFALLSGKMLHTHAAATTVYKFAPTPCFCHNRTPPTGSPCSPLLTFSHLIAFQLARNLDGKVFKMDLWDFRLKNSAIQLPPKLRRDFACS